MPTLVAQVVNVGLLSLSFMLHSSALFLQASSTTVAARKLLEEQLQTTSLASLPFSLLFITAAFLPPVFGIAFKRYGFKIPFFIAAICGIIGGVFASLSIYLQSFAFLCVACTVLGISNTAGNFFRFAATTLVEPAYVPKAVSAVLVSGLAASFLGPFVARQTYQIFADYEYLAVYIALSCNYVLLAIIMLIVQYPNANNKTAQSTEIKQTETKKPEESSQQLLSTSESVNDIDADTNNDGDNHENESQKAGTLEIQISEPYVRSVREILSTPTILVCMIGAGVPYLVMISLMSIVPLAIDDLFEFGAATNVMTLHGISMFLPFFFVSFVVERLPEGTVVLLGLLLLLPSLLLLRFVPDLWSFYMTMASLGIGWSLSFLSSTTLLTKQYGPHERALVQATNDVVVFGLVAIATALASLLYYEIGWLGFLYLLMGIVLFAVLSVALWIFKYYYANKFANKSYTRVNQE